jgi:hypothetical protein
VDRDPAQLKRELAAAFELGLLQLRRERGAVHLPEDTHAAVRRVSDIAQHAGAYEAAFKALRVRAEQALGEELIEAVGSASDGIPLSAMKVPHNGDIIRVSPEFTTVRDIDVQQAAYALAESELATWDFPADDDLRALIVQYALTVASRVVDELYCAAKPKVTGVEALATTLGHHGEDQLASVARSAIGKPTKKFTKIKVERKPAA